MRRYLGAILVNHMLVLLGYWEFSAFYWASLGQIWILTVYVLVSFSFLGFYFFILFLGREKEQKLKIYCFGCISLHLVHQDVFDSLLLPTRLWVLSDAYSWVTTPRCPVYSGTESEFCRYGSWSSDFFWTLARDHINSLG